MVRLLKLVPILGAFALTAPASAQLRPSPLKDIYLSYNDCFEVATAAGLKPAALKPLGWLRATVSQKDGKAVDNAPIIFGHGTRAPLIMLSAEQGEGLCIVMARRENAGSFDDFTKAWGGKLPAPDAEGRITFSDEGRAVQLRRTGSAQEPSLSIAVMTPVESK